MSNREKAKELINLFYQPLGTIKCGANSDEMWEYGKKSALVLVNELIKICPYISTSNCSTEAEVNADVSQFVSYWEGIKEEINNL
jgi:hypothetical protein